ncbi:MAG TPA: hypothetical protein PKW45_12255 [Bryobacteraceae bacterium]|nr:hypothetical protein [Bryobacteraceae bacterium]HOQ44561.1 hypothetical protein [Bryobacteraceae bacterium]
MPARMNALMTAILAALFAFELHAGARPAYCTGEPVTVDFDMESIPEPRETVQSFYYDFLDATFFQQAKQAFDLPRHFRRLAGRPKEALNVNCMDEVPDSSWFTNRNGKRRMTPEEVERGPNRGEGPAGEIWTVIRAKTEGITPGFLIRDEEGQVYQFKFDPPEYPEMATAAEVIASRLYYAAGYNVKENYIVHFTRRQLKVDPGAKRKDHLGRTHRMTEDDLDAILARVARRRNGSYRAVAGKYLDGVPKGPFSFYGMRADDPNDLIPHEHRRDLRGLRLIAAWLNDNDIREGNTLDMYVEEDGRRFLKHYLIDTGSALGSDTTHPNIDRIGNEYQFDAGEIGKAFFSLGLYRRPWQGGSQKVLHPSVGHIDVENFDPGRWKPNYPIVAFENMTDADAVWATRIILSFTDEQIRAAVKSGRFSDPEAEETLTAILIERRDRIGRYWLKRVNPLANFAVAGSNELRFENLEVKYGFAEPDQFVYRYTIRSAGDGAILDRGELRRESIPLAAARAPGVYEIEIETAGNGKPRPRLRVYVRTSDEKGPKLAGIIRTTRKHHSTWMGNQWKHSS